MDNNLEIKKEEKKNKIRIGFWEFYKNKKINWDVKKHFFLTFLITLLVAFIDKTSQNLISGENGETISHSCSSGGNHFHSKISSKKEESEVIFKDVVIKGDYYSIFPDLMNMKNLLKERFIIKEISKKNFSLIFILAIFLCSSLKYYDSFLENRIASKSSTYLKNLLLEKFKSLDFEKRINKQDEAKFLTEIEVETISDSWEHLYNHFFHSFITIILTIWLNTTKLKKMTRKSFLFFVFWIIVYNFVYWLISDFITRKQIEYKSNLSDEISFIDKEISKSLLIESMGLSSSYSSKRHLIIDKNSFLKSSVYKLYSLNFSSNYFLVEVYIYILILISNNPFGEGGIISIFFLFNTISHNICEVLSCFSEYGEYNAACFKVNEFLNLLEKNDNLQKPSLNPSNINCIIFSNVTFKYENNDHNVLINYNRIFSNTEINKLIGNNGTGKSTIIFLLLGMLKPLSGNIIVKMENEEEIDLNIDINLKDWRENIVSYCSHDNLIEEGSTGQRQISNINKTLEARSNSKIFIFDEASNALDKERQKLLTKKINKLIKLKKIIIFVKH